jgi:hypothetical protein
VDVEYGETVHEMFHVIDDIQHLEIKLGIIEGNEGTIENLLAFHNYITSSNQTSSLSLSNHSNQIFDAEDIELSVYCLIL